LPGKRSSNLRALQFKGRRRQQTRPIRPQKVRRNCGSEPWGKSPRIYKRGGRGTVVVRVASSPPRGRRPSAHNLNSRLPHAHNSHKVQVTQAHNNKAGNGRFTCPTARLSILLPTANFSRHLSIQDRSQYTLATGFGSSK